MSYIITQAELEHLGEMQLRAMYSGILADLSGRNLSAQGCPMTRITLENIQTVLRRKRAFKPPSPRF
ncbi:MAG: hypothetical protein PSY14_04480 [bacterium]|nr:hypothetical protein [bacterium]